MEKKLEQERQARQRAEDVKLEMEKKKNELLVDLEQVRSQVNKLAQELKGTTRRLITANCIVHQMSGQKFCIRVPFLVQTFALILAAS